MNIELYINNRLCDIESPEKLGITLKRVFINPSELNVKDAQKSYNISLPATRVNNEIFNYANVEETQGKFKIYGDARLYVDGVLILDGKFRLSEITKDYYRGNLGVPAPLTVKDVFGETMMNQAGRWPVDFKGRKDITAYNSGTYDKSKYGDIPPCIFPLVLYGLLPKDTSLEKNPEREDFDKNVNLDFDDLPPSVNCLQMLQRIFANANYKLSGTAMNDERLKKLFVSYKNPYDYKMPWSVPKMGIKGHWTNYDVSRGSIEGAVVENNYPGISGMKTGTFNMFESYSVNIDEVTDEDGNIEVEKVIEGSIYPVEKTYVKFVIPRSGLYKVEFNAKIAMGEGSFIPKNGGWYAVEKGRFDKKYELKLVRNYGGEEDLKNDRFDNTFYKDNLFQERKPEEFDISFFPQKGAVNFIDPKQNSRFICGFSWGRDTRSFMADFYNPYNLDNIAANPMAISGGRSWDENVDARAYSAVPSPGYMKGSNKSEKFTVKMENTPLPETVYVPAGSAVEATTDRASGHISQVVWLEAGDRLSLVNITGMTLGKFNDITGAIAPHHFIDFDLMVTPFHRGLDWLTVKENGSSDPDKPVMDWNDRPTFYQDEIDLIKYLPEDTKVNDWIDNFCKAFNLNLVHHGGDSFELNTRMNSLISSTANIIDIDGRSHIAQCTNESLKLPRLYELGFSVNTGEEGYYASIDEYVTDEFGRPTTEKVITAGDAGGGKFYTGSHETTEVKQTSNFSYNWFKEIKNTESGGTLILPVITEREIWEQGTDYNEMSSKRYTNLPQRFWFHAGIFRTERFRRKQEVFPATVKEMYDGNPGLVLHYRDEPVSITRTFFFLMKDNNNSYTTVSCYLTPEEYGRLGTALVKLNGDLYQAAEVDGYDPLGKNQCKLKLIRRLV